MQTGGLPELSIGEAVGTELPFLDTTYTAKQSCSRAGGSRCSHRVVNVHELYCGPRSCRQVLNPVVGGYLPESSALQYSSVLVSTALQVKFKKKEEMKKGPCTFNLRSNFSR